MILGRANLIDGANNGMQSRENYIAIYVDFQGSRSRASNPFNHSCQDSAKTPSKTPCALSFRKIT